MGVANSILDIVVDTLLDRQETKASDMLLKFDELVAALSFDSGLTMEEVQSRLIDRMLLDPRYVDLDNNIVRLGDYLHLVAVNSD